MKDTRNDIVQRVVQFGAWAFHYGFIPFLLYLGYTKSNPKPSIMRLISPLA
ncbi:hypothetical protein MIR68_003952 [Amoeboaphelidium protococcarum]|nr:hypothetical protein MIR68_003952 [Amoeboaphelidium protococcarum]